MKKIIFKGAGVAVVTPFDENGVNYTRLEELLNFQIENSVDSIIVCGTTGEASAMTEDEHKSVLKFCIEKVNGRVPVIAGTGSNNTEKTIRLTKFAESIGYDGALIVTPYYNKTTQKGLIEHYSKVADETALPIILYNVPSRTGVSFSIDTLKALDEKYSNIVAIKEASGDVAYAARVSAETDLVLYSGNDDVTLPVLSVGGMGVISVIANIYPKEMHEICSLFFENELHKARELYLKMLSVMGAMFIEVNPIPVKTAMNILGFDVGKLRLPLCEMEENNKEKLKTLLERFETEK